MSSTYRSRLGCTALAFVLAALTTPEAAGQGKQRFTDSGNKRFIVIKGKTSDLDEKAIQIVADFDFEDQAIAAQRVLSDNDHDPSSSYSVRNRKEWEESHPRVPELSGPGTGTPPVRKPLPPPVKLPNLDPELYKKLDDYDGSYKSPLKPKTPENPPDKPMPGNPLAGTWQTEYQRGGLQYRVTLVLRSDNTASQQVSYRQETGWWERQATEWKWLREGDTLSFTGPSRFTLQLKDNTLLDGKLQFGKLK